MRSRAQISAISVLVDAVSWITPLHASESPSIAAHPVGDDFFELGQRRARLPREAEHAEAGADVVAEHAGERCRCRGSSRRTADAASATGRAR